MSYCCETSSLKQQHGMYIASHWQEGLNEVARSKLVVVNTFEGTPINISCVARRNQGNTFRSERLEMVWPLNGLPKSVSVWDLSIQKSLLLYIWRWLFLTWLRLLPSWQWYSNQRGWPVHIPSVPPCVHPSKLGVVKPIAVLKLKKCVKVSSMWHFSWFVIQ